jgi:probable rRNA maturation factor
MPRRASLGDGKSLLTLSRIIESDPEPRMIGCPALTAYLSLRPGWVPLAPCTMILLDPDLDPDPATGTQKISAGALARFLARAQSAVRLRGEVSVLLTTDRAIRRLNREYRGKDKATDVLSFPADRLAQKGEKIAGDLAISVDTARRQSAAQGHLLATELKVLILHGLLHLAGYDHEADNGRMARRELALRAQLGLPHGLIERGSPPTLSRKTRRDGATAPRRPTRAKVLLTAGVRQ